MFEDQFYKQKIGLAIGSSLSPFVAELVMDHVFKKLEERFNSQEVKFKTKYVDDSFCIVQCGKVEEVLGFFNGFHQRVKFTHECHKNVLNFLDVTVMRDEENHLTFKHYKKETYTGRMIHRCSNAPDYVKRNTYLNTLRK